MQAVGTVGIQEVKLVLFLTSLIFREAFHLRKLGCNIRQYKKIAVPVIAATGREKISALICKIDIVILFLDNEI